MDTDVGTIEGDLCNRIEHRVSCPGIIQMHPPEGCCCHINPPCSACVSDRHFCPACGWEAADE